MRALKTIKDNWAGQMKERLALVMMRVTDEPEEDSIENGRSVELLVELKAADLNASKSLRKARMDRFWMAERFSK